MTTNESTERKLSRRGLPMLGKDEPASLRIPKDSCLSILVFYVGVSIEYQIVCYASIALDWKLV